MIKKDNINPLEPKNELPIRQAILNLIQKRQGIVYGARATNIQLPTYLRKETTDYDILVKKPKKSAIELAEQIQRLTSNKVSVEPAQHKGTFKVKVNGNTIADLTQLKRIPRVKNIYGDKYYDIKSIKRNVSKLVKKPSAEFRRYKDISTLQRIKELERLETFNF